MEKEEFQKFVKNNKLINTYLLSGNPNITWEFVQDNPQISWSYQGLSMNPNVTWEIVKII